MSSISSTEIEDYGPPDLATFYISANNIADTQVLYRLYYATNYDHMDSTTAGESGYSTDGPLGYAWTSAADGMAEIGRGVNSSSIHMPLQTGETVAGFSLENFGLYGYQRYGTESLTAVAEDLLSLSDGGVTIASNRVTGGALWNWTWNGTQFINHHDYGREIQTGFSSSYSGQTSAPTEAGCAAGDPTYYQGSPLVSLSNSGDVQTSEAVPLEGVNPDGWGGGQLNPVIWPASRIGKSININWNGLGPVAKYTATIYTDAATSNVTGAPDVYLNGFLTRFYAVDVANAHNSPTEVTSSLTYAGSPVVVDYAYTGAIAANSDGSLAFGVYAPTASGAGKLGCVEIYDFLTEGGTSGCSNSCVALVPITSTGLASGSNSYVSWLMSGTLTQVENYMWDIYDGGLNDGNGGGGGGGGGGE